MGLGGIPFGVFKSDLVYGFLFYPSGLPVAGQNPSFAVFSSCVFPGDLQFSGSSLLISMGSLVEALWVPFCSNIMIRDIFSWFEGDWVFFPIRDSFWDLSPGHLSFGRLDGSGGICLS